MHDVHKNDAYDELPLKNFPIEKYALKKCFALLLHLTKDEVEASFLHRKLTSIAASGHDKELLLNSLTMMMALSQRRFWCKKVWEKCQCYWRLHRLTGILLLHWQLQIPSVRLFSTSPIAFKEWSGICIEASLKAISINLRSMKCRLVLFIDYFLLTSTLLKWYFESLINWQVCQD